MCPFETKHFLVRTPYVSCRVLNKSYLPSLPPSSLALSLLRCLCCVFTRTLYTLLHSLHVYSQLDAYGRSVCVCVCEQRYTSRSSSYILTNVCQIDSRTSLRSREACYRCSCFCCVNVPLRMKKESHNKRRGKA